MTQLTNNFEGGTDGVAISAANSGGTSGNAFDSITGSGIGEFETATSGQGSVCCRYNANTFPSIYFVWSSGLGTLTDHYGRLYFRRGAAPSARGARASRA